MKRNFAVYVGLGLVLTALAGCGTPGDGVSSAPRADQEKAFRGDPSKAPDAVKNMMVNPPANSRPAQPGQTTNP